MRSMEPSDSVVLVTGGSRGIGAATAARFAEAGARVAINYHRSRQRAEELADALDAGTPGRARAFRCDVRDKTACHRMVEEVTEELGPIEVLVNNAGVARPRQIADLDPDIWDEVIRTNLTGAFQVAQTVSEEMREAGGGSIVNVSSIAAQMGTVDCAYAASKAGLLGLTRAMARELGPYGIRVNAVAPGPVETDMGEEILEFLEETDFHGHENLGTFLDRYAARPETIADAIFSLATGEFITGETLTVNGGMYLD